MRNRKPGTDLTSLLILTATLLQAVCLILFVGDIALSITGVFTISWQLHEYIQIGASLGLIVGVGLGFYALRRIVHRQRHVEDQLRAASGAFLDLLEERFDTWGLTPAERDVALFSIKGVPPQDIARMRGVSEGTIKAQTNAIYRKAGVSGRAQLLSLFIDELMGGPLTQDQVA